MVFEITLIVILLAAVTSIAFIRLPRHLAAGQLQSKTTWVVGVQLLGVLVWQLINIRDEEYNVDESTWIADALAVVRNEDFFSALLTHTTARPVTVLPLLILDKLQLPIDFHNIKVIAILLIVLTLLLTFLSLRNLTNDRLATVFILPLTTFYLAVQFDDFLAYNSELICNVFVVSGVWLYSLTVAGRERLGQIFLVGLLLGMVPFAKFQAIPGSLVVVGFCLYQWIRQRRPVSAALFIGAGLLPSMGAVIYCLLTDQITVLVRNYFLYYFHYAYQYSTKPFAERFSLTNLIHYYWKQHTFAAYWYGLLLIAVAGLWPWRRIPFRLSATMLLVVLLWAISIYETIQAGTNYEHYLHLALVPQTLLAALLIYPVIKVPQGALIPVLGSYVAVAIVITLFSRTTPFERGYNPPLAYDSAVIDLIRRECGPTDRITIWGWADRYYALSGVAPAGRYVNSVFQIKPNAQQTYYLEQYATDLKQNKPMLFLDAVAQNQVAYSDRQAFGHEHFPIINNVIETDYRLIYEHEGLRAYKLKDDRRLSMANRLR